jgi:hypothetical protein
VHCNEIAVIFFEVQDAVVGVDEGASKFGFRGLNLILKFSRPL